mgnify:CR=1 FL=1
MTGLLVNDYSQRNPPSLGEAMSGLLGNWGSNIEQGLLSALPVLAENDPYKIGQQLLREGAGVGGIAWHGSPHKYLKPDLSKIGTGEGAQAYGHGFYSAEAKNIGEIYRNDLSGQISLDGKELDFVPNTDDPFGAALVDKMKGDDFVQKLTALIPLERMAEKDEYRSAVQFLCSDASSYMNGQNIVIDGGRSVL